MSQWNAKVKEPQESRQGRGKQQSKEGGSAGKSGSGGQKELKAAMEVARGFIQAKRFDEAIKAFEAILEKAPDTVPAYLGIGNIHAAQGNYDDALEYYAGALHIKKDAIPALLMTGIVYAKQGLQDKALEKFKEVLEINPAAGNASMGLSRVLSKMGRHDEAIKCLTDALQQNPRLDEARLALAGNYQRKGDADAALKEVIITLTHNPESWQAHFHHAKLLAARGEFKQSINACKEALNLKPESASIHNLLGRAYMGIREFDLALKEFNKAIEIDARMITSRLGIARLHIEQGALVEAKKMLIDMTKGSRSLMLVHRLLAEILMRESDYEGAVDEFKAAILHGKKLAERHPEVLTIVPGNSRQTAEAYQKVFVKIETDSSFAIAAEEGIEDKPEKVA